MDNMNTEGTPFVGGARGDLQPSSAPGAAIFSQQAWAEIARSLALSNRELQLIRGVFDDRTELAIAGDLGISPHTVHTYFERLHRKLGASNRVQLVLRVTNEYLTASPALRQPGQGNRLTSTAHTVQPQAVRPNRAASPAQATPR
jgi:DNA-binding CsgD family transcriptional regulator